MYSILNSIWCLYHTMSWLGQYQVKTAAPTSGLGVGCAVILVYPTLSKSQGVSNNQSENASCNTVGECVAHTVHFYGVEQ